MFYTNSIILPKKGLQNFLEILEKTENQISAKNLAETEIMASKLAPDMFDFGLQIKRIIGQAIEMSETFSGKKSEIIVEFDKNYSLSEYKNLISETINFLENISENEITNPETKEVRFFWLPGKKIIGEKYLNNWAVPNFYFHLTTAYNILRNQGFELGKGDFLGNNFVSSLLEDK